jgi:F-type H+-transporting ATPase subunit epsilon
MFTFELVTLNGVKFGQEVYEVILPTPDGIIAIFPNHMPLISLVEHGVISIRHSQGDSDAKMDHYAINGGIVEVGDKRIRVLVDEADHSSEVLESEVAEALKRAKELEKSSDERVNIDKARQQIQMAQARLRVADIKKRHKIR